MKQKVGITVFLVCMINGDLIASGFGNSPGPNTEVEVFLLEDVTASPREVEKLANTGFTYTDNYELKEQEINFCNLMSCCTVTLLGLTSLGLCFTHGPCGQ